MSIQFYNTLTKKKEEFKPLSAGKINMYVCGPTVYDYFHIGNARTFVMTDILHRYLVQRGYDVKYIMNLTDVDDKIIKKGNEQGIDSSEVAKKYADAFFEDLDKLGVRRAVLYPRATENIKEMVDLISGLIEMGKAYVLGNDVYYSIEKFEGYGKLSGKNIEDLKAGARIDVDEEKKNPLDFALWKGAKEGEPSWESPWGKGRPGWHIECSAMSMKYLGETIDIHCGGHDLIFPHHENEIAQSEGFTGKPFSNYWIHFGFLNIDNQKMSKSLGNFFTTRDILEKYSANTIRMYFMQTHYSAPLNWSEEGLEAAKNGYERIVNSYSEVHNHLNNGKFGDEKIDLTEYEKKFIEYMDDDLNSPRAVSVLFDLIKSVNQVFSNDHSFTKEILEEIIKFLEDKFINAFGILLSKKSASDTVKLTLKTSDPSVNVELGIEEIIEKRKEAKANKNWALADEIRKELKEKGIILEDKKDGTTLWKMETK
jgi:cysteinyl-tRNA synthetase